MPDHRDLTDLVSNLHGPKETYQQMLLVQGDIPYGVRHVSIETNTMRPESHG